MCHLPQERVCACHLLQECARACASVCVCEISLQELGARMVGVIHVRPNHHDLPRWFREDLKGK